MFDEVVGQAAVKEILRRQVVEKRIPHALMLCGGQGRGKFALAFSLARYLLCEHPEAEGCCGHCHACKMTADLAHPDLFFVYPVIKKKGSRHDPVSEDYLEQWRKMVKDSPYFSFDSWLAAMETENQQAQIYTAESDFLTSRLYLKSAMGGYKIVILWMPEKLHPVCANKLLKLLEEPPKDSLFILVSQQPENILPTILSRTQRIDVPPVREDDICEALQTRFFIQEADANVIARRANGNFLTALEQIHVNQDREFFFDQFTSLMRLAYQRDIRSLKDWSLTMADLGRERQKNFLTYMLRLLRENFIYNFKRPELNYLGQKEAEFSVRFARFVNERNIIPLMKETENAWQDIARNVNPKMVFFDFTLKVIVLLIR